MATYSDIYSTGIGDAIMGSLGQSGVLNGVPMSPKQPDVVELVAREDYNTFSTNYFLIYRSPDRKKYIAEVKWRYVKEGEAAKPSFSVTDDMVIGLSDIPRLSRWSLASGSSSVSPSAEPDCDPEGPPEPKFGASLHGNIQKTMQEIKNLKEDIRRSILRDTPPTQYNPEKPFPQAKPLPSVQPKKSVGLKSLDDRLIKLP